MRTNSRAASLLLSSTAAFAAITVAFAGTASAAPSSDLDGSCNGRKGTVITLDLEGYNAVGRNSANVSLDGSRPSTVSFGAAYNWSSGSLDNTVAHTAQIVVRSAGPRAGAAVRTVIDTITVPACR